MKNTKTNLKLPKYLLIILVILQVSILTAQFFALNKYFNTSSIKNSSPFLPFWVAIFIPLIYTINKKRRNKEQTSAWLWILVGIAAFVLIIMTAFFLVIPR